MWRTYSTVSYAQGNFIRLLAEQEFIGIIGAFFVKAGVSKTQKVSFENLKTESDDYKVKAQRILQSKGNDFIFA